MIGRKVHHYQITEKLGEGGMGVVYRAEDTKLNRTVALKFLNPAWLDSPAEQERLVTEARASAGLHHPNICTIYEINEYEGQTFIVMGYVDGATLRDRVLSERIEIHEALRYIIQIADGLKQAHQRDIVHRDIKSSNIMVNSAGQAIIMDFGLARRSGAPRGDERFSSGGTSAYMAPEQARGEAVDQRTDIWSLGVVLYEMVAGRLPFRGDYESAVIYSILNESPRPITDIRPDVPRDVVDIVERCLAKDPSDRFQSLDDLIAEVRLVLDRVTGGSRPGSGSRAPAARRGVARSPLGLAVAAVLTLVAAFLVYDFIRGQMAGSEIRIPIAVIDFNNETTEQALDGLSGMLITALEQSRRLSVMTRTRMFDVLKRQGREDVNRITESIGQEICQATGTGALVIPSIRKFGELYTIDLKVLDTRSNEYIFTARVEGEGQESIPGMIDQLARDIRVDLREGPGEVEATTRLADVTTVNLEAYQHYFEGERLLNDLDFKRAHELFEEAVSLDSTFALAYYRLAYTEWWSQGQLTAARNHVARAMSMIDRIPRKERFLVRALEAGLNEGFEAQIAIYKEMRRYYPRDKEMLFGLGDSEFHTANYDSALVHFEQVLDIDPEFDRALQHLTWTYYFTDRLDQAQKMAQRWADTTGSVEAYTYLASMQMQNGHEEEAMKTLDRADHLDPGNFMVQRQRAEFHLSAGDPELAARELQSVLRSDTSGMDSFYAGRALSQFVYPHLGRIRDAMELYKGVEHLAAAGKVDSSVLAQTVLGLAELQYWAYDDEEAARALVARAEAFPEKYKKDYYWRVLASTCMVLGDEAQAQEIFDTKVGDLPPLQENLYAVFRNARAGRCDRALAIVDSVFPGRELRRYGGILREISHCLLESGRYDEVVTRIEPLIDGEPVLFSTATMLAPNLILLAKAHEARGEPERAIEYYRRALEIWKNADDDLPMKQQAEARLEALVSARSM